MHLEGSEIGLKVVPKAACPAGSPSYAMHGALVSVDNDSENDLEVRRLLWALDLITLGCTQSLAG